MRSGFPARFSILALLALLALAPRPAAAQGSWAPSNNGINEVDIQCMAVGEGPRPTLFVGTSQGVYRSTDGGGFWDAVMTVSGAFTAVNQIAVAPGGNRVFAATQNGLYRSDDGGRSWGTPFRGIGTFEGVFTTVHVPAADRNVVLAGTLGGAFVSQDGGSTWTRVSGDLGNRWIRWVDADRRRPGHWFVASSEGLHRTTDAGRTWNRVFVASEDQLDLEDFDLNEVFLDEGPVELQVKTFCVAVDPRDGQKVYLGSFDGVRQSTDGGATFQPMTTVGIGGSSVRQVAPLVVGGKTRVFAVTRRGIYVLSEDQGQWEERDTGLANRDARYLAGDARGSVLWSAVPAGPYRMVLAAAEAPPPGGNGGTQAGTAPAAGAEGADAADPEVARVLEAFGFEPTIQEVQAIAIDYAEVSKDKIDSWYLRSNLRRLLPDVDVSRGRTIDIRGSTERPFYVTGPDDTDVSLSWNLSELIWSSDQTSIDTRSRLMVQLRDDVLDEVNKVYFERRRIQVELLTNPPKALEARVTKQLRLQELTAQLDALTGTWFSQAVHQRRAAAQGGK